MTQTTDGIARKHSHRVLSRKRLGPRANHGPQFHGRGVIARPGFKVLPRFALSLSLSLSLV